MHHALCRCCLGCYAVWTCRLATTYRRNVLPPTSAQETNFNLHRYSPICVTVARDKVHEAGTASSCHAEPRSCCSGPITTFRMLLLAYGHGVGIGTICTHNEAGCYHLYCCPLIKLYRYLRGAVFISAGGTIPIS
jgi:hypothetical protein